jgi:N-acetylglucosaminyl-diphospho-decaprenol L-rhamnosyltransferase
MRAHSNDVGTPSNRLESATESRGAGKACTRASVGCTSDARFQNVRGTRSASWHVRSWVVDAHHLPTLALTPGTESAVGAQPDVSVIVVNYRSAELTIRALEAARRSAGALLLEQIVVDNASGEADVELLGRELPEAAVITLAENRGFAAGNNAGIAQATGRYLLLLNPDAFARDDALAQLVRHLDAHPAAGLAAPVLENEDGTIQANLYLHFPSLATLFVEFCFPLALVAVALRTRRAEPARARAGWLPIAHAIGAALLVRAEAARATGPLDERFFLYLEETEWQRRMAAAGWRRDGVPSARFVHLGGGSSGSPTIASPHYLDSAALFFRHGRAAERVIGVAAAVSWVWLNIFRLLGLGTGDEDRLRSAFGELLRLLRTRRRERLAS